MSAECQTVRDLMLVKRPDIFMLQEHWLIPYNLSRLEEKFPNYMYFGSSALASCIESGIGLMRGRPFSALMMLVKKVMKLYVQLIDMLSFLLASCY
jgi:hypothetical protein